MEEDEEEDEKAVDEQVGREEVVRGVDVLPAVLGPLMGGEEYDVEVSNSFAFWSVGRVQRGLGRHEVPILVC